MTEKTKVVFVADWAYAHHGHTVERFKKGDEKELHKHALEMAIDDGVVELVEGDDLTKEQAALQEAQTACDEAKAASDAAAAALAAETDTAKKKPLEAAADKAAKALDKAEKQLARAQAAADKAKK